MRNLKNVRASTNHLDSDLPLSAQAWDTASDSLICAFGPSKAKEVIELRRVYVKKSLAENSSLLITSWDAPSPLPELNADRIINLHHFAYSDTTCLVLAGGDIVVVRGQVLSGQEKIEIVGSVDAGITAAAWSPDEELLAVATRASTLLFMTADFDNVANVSFNPEDIKLSKHVSVGWGKSETQFKGKRAKALRDPTMPETVDEGTLSTLDYGQDTISWRGDGAYVAVNSIEGKIRRMIRIYSREGILDSVTEPVDGLEGALSWRPAGNLLAGIQRLGDQVNVIFFERNGLRHGHFPLRLTSEDSKNWASAIELRWNIDSSILAVSFKDRVQLWTMGNYHYYLKQIIHITERNGGLGALSTLWHPEQALRIAVRRSSLSKVESENHIGDTSRLCAYNNMFHLFQYVLAINTGSAAPPNDFGLTVVIDGRSLKITPLRIANVPPPMALHEIELVNEAKDVAINSTNTRIAILHERSITVLRCETGSKPLFKPDIEKTLGLGLSNFQITQQICFRGVDDLYVLFTDSLRGFSSLFNVYGERLHNFSENCSFDVLRLFPSVDYKGIYIGTETGTEEIMNMEDPVTTSKICATPSSTPWVEVTRLADQTIAFGLTASGILYANDRLLLRNCTSFLLTTAHLIVTTTNHLLKFIHVTEVANLQVPSDEPERDERCRSIERGARLVAVMPSSYSLTLQMPRGNLETIFPRALVLAGIRRSIENKQYRKAFLACRNQRVDMNILHDHAPEQFLASIELFIDQLRTVEYIDLFLSQLRDEDVSQTMYKETLTRADQAHNINRANGVTSPTINRSATVGKVNGVCEAFLEILQSKYKTNLQNTITANVCKIPPDIKAGLSVVASLRDEQSDLAEKAVEHICFLADVNQVYDQALGMYDLELALLVAQQSQKDPREYLPYLQSLQEMPQLRKQFKIDDDLGRHETALQHLHSMKESEEVRIYTQKHELYKQALELYRYEPQTQALMLRTYADFLSRRNRFKEAAIAYDSLSDHQDACEAYRAANLWRESLSSAMSVPLPSEELTSLAHSLAGGLVESKDFVSAAAVLLDYLSDVETATRYLCKGYLFAEATRIARLRNQPGLITTVIDPGLVEGSATLTELLADCKTQLEAQLPRLRELRKIKSEDPLAFFEGAEASDIPDNVSLAPSATSTTGASLFTRYTTHTTGTINTATSRKTSKNRRREERKRARGKKGSVYEEGYLVNSIDRLIDRVNSVAEEVERTVEGLLKRGMRERARAVEVAMVEVTEACRGCVAEVYEVLEKNEMGVGGEGENHGGMRPPGADGVLWDSVEEGRRKRTAPVVKEFERSGLLA